MTTIFQHIATLLTLADEMAAARRWNEAHAIQTAIMALRGMETPSLAEECDEVLHENLLTR